MSNVTMEISTPDDAWYECLGLFHDPFADHVPGFRFFTAKRKPVLAQLHHLARYSQLMLLVVGPKRSGKSLLRQALMASSNKQATRCLSFSAKQNATAEALLREIALSLRATTATVEAIMACVGEASLNSQEVHLLVDDAELLEADAFQALVALSVGGAEGRIHVFLFGEPITAEHALAEAAEYYHVIELQPYCRDEAAAYLSQRLEAAGAEDRLLSEEQITEIHRRSGGWPGVINEVAQEFLASQIKEEPASLQSLDSAGSAFSIPWRSAISVLGVGIALVSAAVFFLDRPGQLPPAGVMAWFGANKPIAPPQAAELGSAKDNMLGESRRPLPLPLVEKAKPVLDESAGAEVSRADQSITPGLAKPIAYEPPVALEPVASTDDSSIDIPPGSASVAATVPRTATAEFATVPPVMQDDGLGSSRIPAAPASALEASAAGDPYAWYGAQPGNHYLLQVIATRSAQTARHLVERHGDAFHYFRKFHEGQPLYVVTYGQFTDRHQAARAISQLPAPLRAAKPWVRRVGDVQQEIRAAR